MKVSDERNDQAEAKAEAVLEVRLLCNERTNHFGVFILSERRNFIVVNDSAFRKNLLVGPLPDFAALEVAGHTLFWWGSKEALYYTPKTEP